jgi:uncharacterized membrane protein
MNTQKIALSAISAALVFAATYFLRIPIPSLSGAYFNLGDIVIYFAAALFGGVPAAFAGLVGSVLADITAGAVIYAPATAIIKFSMGLTAGRLCFGKDTKWVMLASTVGGFIMVSGYALYETLVFGGVYAIAALPTNIIQGISAIVASLALFPLLGKIKGR